MNILNTIAFLFMIIVNYLANALPLNNQTTADISNKLDVLFTPAGYVFSIWGLIYSLVGFWVVRGFFTKKYQQSYRISFPYIMISSLFNGCWIILWHYEWFFTSIIIIITLLISLFVAYFKIKSVSNSLFDLLPFSIYSGWVSVATIANIAYTLNDSKLLSHTNELYWTICMLILTTFVAILFLFKEKDLYYSLVFIWAFIGIANRNMDISLVITNVAYGCTLFILIAIIIFIWRFKKPFSYGR